MAQCEKVVPRNEPVRFFKLLLAIIQIRNGLGVFRILSNLFFDFSEVVAVPNFHTRVHLQAHVIFKKRIHWHFLVVLQPTKIYNKNKCVKTREQNNSKSRVRVIVRGFGIRACLGSLGVLLFGLIQLHGKCGYLHDAF